MDDHGGEGLGHSYAEDSARILARMRRIEGQAKGIHHMIEEGRYCMDVVQQLTALSSAADEVALLVLEDHLRGCVSNAIRENRGDASIEEVMAVFRKALRR